MTDGPLRLTVHDVVAETPDSRSLVFQPPRGWDYRPGQFLTVRVPGEDGGSMARCYSLSSSPHTDALLKVTVKSVGPGSAWLCAQARPGLELDVLPPSGKFTPKSLDGELLLVAAGSGITPIMSITKSALAAGRGRIVLLYANRDENSVIFRDELRELVAQHPERLTVVHWLETLQGLPGPETLAATLRPFTDSEIYTCGPPAFMDAVTAALRALEVPRKRVHAERFTSLAGNPFDRHAPAPPTPAAESAAAARLRLQLDREHHEMTWPQETKLLDLLLDEGLDAPYSCREGRCSACVCLVRSGEVKMLQNNILEQEDLDEGYVLGCQSVPVTDDVEITYDE
ncbi:2Fe-2S iron-sulfur cluster-binding protein [Saccharopolyspora griseoalba]|uniref:2Fe-2S iron-sulfur cluster-binding protein n=1 Tax=Saccharopolyspora griseoalba TaxID=1431848 RepID=A0ABW2LNZ1_9PSEU